MITTVIRKGTDSVRHMAFPNSIHEALVLKYL